MAIVRALIGGEVRCPVVVELPDEWFTVKQGDSRYIDRYLQKVSSPEHPLITCSVTSPPYGDLKDYGHPDQIGFGQPYDDYLYDCRRVFRAIYRHTAADGSMWVVADTMRGSDGSRGVPERLRPVPFDLAAEAEDVGWVLRETIIWKKDKTRPWSGKGRLRNAFEYVLLFVKSSDFKFHVDRIREQDRLEEWWVKWPERYNPMGKVPTNIWEFRIPVQGTWGDPLVAHACPLPPGLVERLVLLSSDPGDVVFDPFAGTGTVVAEATALGRRGLGIELNPAYVDAYERVVKPLVVKRQAGDAPSATALTETLLRLRALKYARVLARTVTDGGGPPAMASVVLTRAKRPKGYGPGPHELVTTRTLFLVDGPEEVRDEFRRQVKMAADRPPASKMGVGGELLVIRPEDVTDEVPRKTLYRYPRGRTWMAAPGRVRLEHLQQWAAKDAEAPHSTVFADVAIREQPRRWLAGADENA